MSKELFASGQLPKLTISVFEGDPLQYPVWESAFNALADSRPLAADIKLNVESVCYWKAKASCGTLSSDWDRRCLSES